MGVIGSQLLFGLNWAWIDSYGLCSLSRFSASILTSSLSCESRNGVVRPIFYERP